MMLYINGSDIAQLVLGVLNDDRSAFLVDPVAIPSSPEQYLAHVDSFLKNSTLHPRTQIQVHSYTLHPTPSNAGHGSPASLTGIIAVLGPGSATALRTSLTIVNALAFAKRIPVFGIELTPGADDRMVLVGLCDASSIPMARPVYANPARITVSTRDALGRR